MTALETAARLVQHWAGPSESDGHLVERFRRFGDEAAFAELVERHGPMVLGVCRRVLRHPHDAEDAFQAAFLVLARKAGASRQEHRVAAWLFQVARRLALRLRARQMREPCVALGALDPAGPALTPADDLQPILEEELARLPEDYRAVLVLCCLERRSQREAARMLATTEDAVNTRLKRARGLLRQRLRRRGVTVSAVPFAAALAQSTASAVSASLGDATMRAALQFAKRLAASGASARAVGLARGELDTMSPWHKSLACLFVLVGALLTAAAGIDGTTAPDDKPAAKDVKREGDKPAALERRRCIILWMCGGLSQLDTFDPKPGAATGGPFKAIDTVSKGITFSEHLPRLAKLSDQLAILRGVTHTDNSHVRATYLMRSGRLPGGTTAYPPFPAVLAKELGDEKSDLPGWVCLTPLRGVAAESFIPGFLDARFGPIVVGEVKSFPAFDAPVRLPLPHVTDFKTVAWDRSDAMRAAVAKAFDLDEEKAALRDQYGRNQFGQGCLLARRLIERGVPVVEVTQHGWIAHADHYPGVRTACAQLDAAFASLLTDLRERKLLDDTLIVCMGEFGRTPRINAGRGRDNWPIGFSVVLAGRGIKGGQAIGVTSADGKAVVERPITPQELLATIYTALGIDPRKEYRSNLKEDVPLVDKGTEAVKEALR